MMLASCTTSVDKPPPSIAVNKATSFDRAFVPAPRKCPVGLGNLRGTGVTKQAEVIHLMGDHLPTWFPSGFGLTGAWTFTADTWVIWSDEHCRSVEVYFNRDEGRPAILDRGLRQAARLRQLLYGAR
jgi:hypothetical protein